MIISLHVERMTKAIASIKWLIGALLGYLMVSYICLSIIGRLPLLAVVLGIVVAIFAGEYAKKHLAILFLAFIAICAASFWNVARNKFRESINASTKPSDLIKSSEQAGVGLSVGEIRDAPESHTAESAKVSIWFEQSFWNGDSHIHAIFTQTPHINEDGTTANCHACSAVIGVVTYKQANGKWEFISMQPEIAEYGQWGKAPKVKQAKVLQLAPDNVALLIHETSLNQSFYTSRVGLLAFSKNKWRDLSSAEIGVIDDGDCSDLLPSNKDDKNSGRCWNYKGEVSIKAGSNPEYPDLLITQTGIERGKDKMNVVPVNRIITYIFDGEKYIESKAN